MKKIVFPAEQYIYVEEPVKVNNLETGKIYKGYKFDGEGILGTLELIWNGLIGARPEGTLTRKDHKTIKKLKAKIKEITKYKDEDEDARIAKDGEQILLIEDSEEDMLKKLLESNKFLPVISDEVDLMWEIIESAVEFKPQPIDSSTPQLVKE